MGEPRPIEENPTQARQAVLLKDTGNGPTVDNETVLLEEQFGPADANGLYGAPTEVLAEPGGGPRALGGNSGGREAMIAAMERWLGTGEPNAIQSWYRQRNGADYSGNFPWCDATATRSSFESDTYDAVCHGTDYAYTVAHAQRFKTAGQWTAMTQGIAKSGVRRGDIIFFDWDGSSSIGAIDHVGIVTSVSSDGKYVYTIEGNTANVCARRVRVVHDIAGYGRPAYATTGTPPTASSPARYKVTINGLAYGYGAAGQHITAVGKALVAKGFGTHYTAGPSPTWSDADTQNYSDYQKSLGLKGTAAGQDADGIPGASTLTKLLGKLPAPPATKPAKPTPAVAYEPFPGAAFFHGGRHSPIVTAMGRRLVAENCGRYNAGPGPNWTNADRNSYAAWQRKLGYTGTAADGIPGKASWDKLHVPNS